VRTFDPHSRRRLVLIARPTDWEIGIRESGGPEMAAMGDMIG
jgi:hypothetical protein